MNNKGYTIKQISDLIGVSKQAVQKVIKQHNISYDDKEKNRQIYFTNTTIKIISAMRSDFDYSKLDFNVADLPQTDNQKTDNSTTETDNKTETEVDDPFSSAPKSENKTDNSATNTDNQQTTENQVIEVLRLTIDTLQNQLNEKDKQIEYKDRQIEMLTRLLHTEQMKTVKAIEEMTEEHQQQKKKGLFSRLFKKNT